MYPEISIEKYRVINIKNQVRRVKGQNIGILGVYLPEIYILRHYAPNSHLCVMSLILQKKRVENGEKKERAAVARKY